MKIYKIGLPLFVMFFVMTVGCANPFPENPSDYQIEFEPHTITIKFNYQMETQRDASLKLEDLFNFSLEPAIRDSATTCNTIGPVVNNGEASCTVTLKETWPPLEVEALRIVATTAKSPEEIADQISNLTDAERQLIIQQLRSAPISFPSALLDISDIDDDGVANKKDSCIDVKGTEADGCPDPASEDKCPTLLGIQPNGCPEAAPEDDEDNPAGEEDDDSVGATNGGATNKTPVFDPSSAGDDDPQKSLVQRNVGSGGDGCQLNPNSQTNPMTPILGFFTIILILRIFRRILSK